MTSNPTPSLEADRRAAIELSLASGVGPRLYRLLIEAFGSPAAVLAATEAELQQLPGVGTQLSRSIREAADGSKYNRLIQTCEQHQIRMIDCGHSEYPAPLIEIDDPPPLLFCQGRWRSADALALAVVGSRHATRYGLRAAEQLARGLSLAGFTIVSGLARGIDAAAHRAALESGGRTIAVLGSGHLELYPPEHRELAAEVVAQGALLSEWPPWQRPASGHFPQRNRILSGLSLGVIVVEAGARSGALISARLAMEQNREVFAVPGPIDSRMSVGCHELIRDGATLVQSVDDVLEQLGPLANPTPTGRGMTVHHPAELKLTDQEAGILNRIGNEPMLIDNLIAESGLPAPRVLSTISVLEIRKLVSRVGGNRLVRG